MRTYIECIPCFFKHALRSANVAGASKKKQREILNELGHLVEKFPSYASPPEIAGMVNNLVSQITGQADIYKKVKKNSNERALQMYSELKRKVRDSSNPLMEAVEIAIAGNVIDYGVHDREWIEKQLEIILKREKKSIFHENKRLFDYKAFKRVLKNAYNILYLADNAGETVFDRILIEEIQKEFSNRKNITYVVKEKPAINDALEFDAKVSGVDKVASVISSGSDVPGTILSRCFPSFRKNFTNAEMVISKGQGNFEALSQVKRSVFFLLMIKCPVIAGDITASFGRCSVGDIALLPHLIKESD